MSGIESWSTTPANNNQAPPFGWPAGILPSQVEPIGRQMMTSLAVWYQAAEWINYNFTPTYVSATQFTMPGNVTATFHVGRRVQATDGATSVYGTITVSAFTTLTTVTVVWDSGVLQTGVTIVYVGITSLVNTSAPTQTTFTTGKFGDGTAAAPSITFTSDTALGLYKAGTDILGVSTAGVQRATVNASGQWTINAPAAGVTALSVTGVANTSTANFQGSTTSGQSFGPTITAGTTSADACFRVFNATGATNYFTVRGDGIVQAVDDGGTLQTVGWRDIPPNSQTVSYQLGMADRGKGVDFNGTTLTCTIPANASVAFPIGTTIVITNLNASNLSIAITTDTLTLAGTTTTGTRTLVQNGVATARKVAATSWIISGAGLA